MKRLGAQDEWWCADCGKQGRGPKDCVAVEAPIGRVRLCPICAGKRGARAGPAEGKRERRPIGDVGHQLDLF